MTLALYKLSKNERKTSLYDPEMKTYFGHQPTYKCPDKDSGARNISAPFNGWSRNDLLLTDWSGTEFFFDVISGQDKQKISVTKRHFL